MLSKNIKNILLSFIIGSSWISFVMWFRGFNSYTNSKKNKKYGINKNNCLNNVFNMEPYYVYTIIAPLFMGIMSSLAVAISIYFKLSIIKSFFIISIISPILVSIAIKLCNIYTFTELRYKFQYLKLMFYHSILYNILIVNIYKLLK